MCDSNRHAPARTNQSHDLKSVALHAMFPCSTLRQVQAAHVHAIEATLGLMKLPQFAIVLRYLTHVKALQAD